MAALTTLSDVISPRYSQVERGSVLLCMRLDGEGKIGTARRRQLLSLMQGELTDYLLKENTGHA